MLRALGARCFAMYFTHFVRKRASSRTTDSAGSAEGAESVESVVESVGSQILFGALEPGVDPAAQRERGE